MVNPNTIKKQKINMEKLQGKIILITGAGQGLGAATAEMLSKEGAIILCADIKEQKVQETVEKISQNGGETEAITIDVSREESIDQAIEKILKKYKTIDVLINNAGLDADPKPIEEYSLADFEKVINVNLRGPFLLISKILPYMYKNNNGHIVNVGSTASLRTWPNASLYHISKTALRGLSWSLFTEIREKKSQVRVSTIIPGGMKTAHVVERFPDMDFSWLQDPASVAKAIKFILLQPEKSVIPELMIIPPLEWSLP